MYDYFKSTELDKEFYRTNLKERLPKKILDVHMHINIAEHYTAVTKERIANDWAFQCGYIMSVEDIAYYSKTLYPDQTYLKSAFPMPIKEADISLANEYLANELKQGTIDYAFMCVRPEWDKEFVEKVLLEGRFVGFKPYPDMVSGQKGAEIGIFDFITKDQLDILNKHKKAMMLHLPRAGRLPDDNNIAELKRLKNEYPDIKVIIAHFGRCYCYTHFKAALEKLGNDVHHFYFDTAAVINPEIYKLAFDHLDHSKILYGSDLPIFLWHGKRRWTKDSYINLSREHFDWVKEKECEKEQNQYTFFVYEQMNNLLNTAQQYEDGLAQKVLHDNADTLLKSCRDNDDNKRGLSI